MTYPSPDNISLSTISEGYDHVIAMQTVLTVTAQAGYSMMAVSLASQTLSEGVWLVRLDGSSYIEQHIDALTSGMTSACMVVGL